MTTRCKLTVKAQCPDTRATYYVEAYRGKVWITASTARSRVKRFVIPPRLLPWFL